MKIELMEIAQNLAITCLSHRDLCGLVLEGGGGGGEIKGKPEILGARLGQFCGSIYNALEKAAQPSEIESK